MEQQKEMQKPLQAFQQVRNLERQDLFTRRTEQQKSLQDFTKEQSHMQQQLLQRMVNPAKGNCNWAQGWVCVTWVLQMTLMCSQMPLRGSCACQLGQGDLGPMSSTLFD